MRQSYLRWLLSVWFARTPRRDRLDRLFALRTQLEALEDRTTPTTFTVSNTTDGGAGSLRQAILDANANPGADAIAFAIGTGPQTIAPALALPTITEAVTIDGTTQPGYAGSPLTEVDGVLAGNSYGIVVNGAAASGSTIKGLAVNRFALSGILVINGANGVRIEANYVGTDTAGATDLGNGAFGVDINKSSGAIITGNLISGNDDYGISLSIDGVAGSVNGTVITGNSIGVNAAGTAAVGNAGGVVLDGATNTLIGGTTAAARNIISGNTTSIGVTITGAGATGNVVQGNYIGTDKNGTTAKGNYDGVFIGTGAFGNTIGGTAANAGNVLSGNSRSGVIMAGAGPNNLIQGNLIGTDPTGATAVGNGSFGVVINSGSSGNTVGGTAANAGNVISGNGGPGIQVSVAGGAVDGITIQGNRIGTNKLGTLAVANGTGGILVISNLTTQLVTNLLIGGTAAGAGNIISGNTAAGVRLSGVGVQGAVVQGNYIGTNKDGTGAVGNQTGVQIDSGATGNTIGGTTAGARNVISGNAVDGVLITGSGTTRNVILGNYIGTNAAGTAAVPNAGDGIFVRGGAHDNTIGSTTDRVGLAGTDVFVVDETNNRVFRYDPITGSGTAFTPAGFGGRFIGVTVGPDGFLYVADLNTDRVLRFNGSTGAFYDTIVATGAGGLDGPIGLGFTDGGDLLVYGRYSQKIHRYSTATGAYLGAFWTSTTGSATGGFTRGPDGFFYATRDIGGNNGEVVRINPVTGVGVAFATMPAGQAVNLLNLTFAGGLLYVASSGETRNGVPSRIFSFNATTGSYLGVVAQQSVAGAYYEDVDVGPDGNLFVTISGTNSRVQRFSPAGVDLGTFVANGSGGLGSGIGLTFVAAQTRSNIISGNTGSGVTISGIGTTGNTILGNYIGTNAAGGAALGNTGAGEIGRAHV